MLSTLMASAYDAKVDGVYYNLIEKAKLAEVTSGDTKYTGSVTIPESVTYNGVTYSVTSIGEKAFYTCSGLTSIVIPNSVTSIGSEAFEYCFGLTSVTIPNSVTSIGGTAFYTCSGLTSVTIPNSVTSIGSCAFYKCSGLTSVTIGSGVTSIGFHAFSGCSGLTSVTIPNSVTSIGVGAFRECRGLTSVTIPNSVTSIGGAAFSGCSGLVTIILGSGIKEIRSSVFASCPELTDVYCYAINVPNTESDAFNDSYINYATLHVPAESLNAYNTVAPWKNFKEIVALTDNDPKPNATGINVVRNSEGNKAILFNLNGVRLSEPQKGINIIKGKKYVKK